MLFFAAILMMIAIASLLSKHGVSAARKKWTIIAMATIFYPFVLGLMYSTDRSVEIYPEGQ